MTQPPSDRQSQAFREAGPADRWDGHLPDIETAGGTVHDPVLELSDVVLPWEYELGNWDADRVGPKTPQEAAEALAARIADPAAPDSEHDAGAYDDWIR